MQAGKLRERVTILAPPGPEQSQDSFGTPADVYDAVATRWAEVKELSGRELWYAEQVQSSVTHEVTFRWFQGLTEKHRLDFQGRTLEIDSITRDSRKREMTVRAVERS